VQTFVFTPIQPNVSLRFWIHNNNTTSAHTAQTLTIWATNSTLANVSLIGQSDIWVQAKFEDNGTVGAQCLNVNANNAVTPGASGMGTCYSSGMYVAQIAIQFTPGGAAAGTPDTFDLGIVQQPSVIPSGPIIGGDDSSGNGTALMVTTATALQGSNANLARLLRCFSADTGSLGNCVPGVYSVMQGVSGNERPESAPLLGDGASTGLAASANYYQNGSAAFDQGRSQSSANATTSGTAGTVLKGIAIVSGPAQWSARSVQTASTCSVSVAASVTTRHCSTGVTACIGATAAQPSVFVQFRDGATGAGTVIWSGLLIGTIGNGMCVSHNFEGALCGTLNTAMTLELSAATAATNTCSAAFEGYDTQ
jgi:hypothetical protein